MRNDGIRTRRLAQSLLAGALALLLSLSLSLLLSHFRGQVLAHSTPGIAASESSLTRSVGTYVQLGNPQLEAHKSVSRPGWARPGGYLTYTVRIHNIGDGDADTVWMTDRLPPVASYVTDSLTATMGSFGEAGGVITWNATLGPTGTLSLPANLDAAITYTVLIPPDLTENRLLTNTAEVTGAGSLVRAEASAWAIVRFHVYLPSYLKRWPPFPYAPILNSVTDPGEGLNDYAVTWSYDHSDVPVILYTLQEATNTEFTGTVNEYTVTYAGTESEEPFIDKEPDGTYYYRVRGHNEYGYGAWSSVVSVTVFTAYYDNFDDSSSGWPIRSVQMMDDDGDIAYWHTRYNSNDYQIYVGDVDGRGPADWFHQPVSLAPYRPSSDKYCVETEAMFVEGHYWANMGLVFGANEDGTQFYALCLGRDSDKQRLGWFVVRQDEQEVPGKGCSHPDLGIAGWDRTGTSRDGWNLLQVGVDGNKIKVYIDENYREEYTMEGLSGMTRVGVVGGNAEIPPTDIHFRYFKVLPGAVCNP